MKQAWIVVGVLVLVIAAFFAGQFLSRPFLMAPRDGQIMRDASNGGFMEISPDGETFNGSVLAIENNTITIGNGSEQFIFQIASDTRLIDIGELDGVQVGDTVEVIYQGEAEGFVALNITSQN